jgi:ElaB/YqjD/DUF883 family membrane-anchored ribosome-binding protein
MDEALRDDEGRPNLGSGSYEGTQAGGPVPISDKAREQISEGIDKTREQLDAGIEKSAGELKEAADRLRAAADDMARVQKDLGERVAGEMESAAGYLKGHSSSAILSDIGAYIRQRPGLAVAGAAFAGIVMGRAMRHRHRAHKDAA